jgi:NitT/TauT family transport system substrate-binding protein
MQFRMAVPATPFGIGLINPGSASWLTRDIATEGDLMSHTRRRLLSTAMLGAASAVTGACSGHRPGPNDTRPLERVTYLTGLGAFGREAFAWVAAAKGCFRDAGLEVTIVPGAAGDENLKKIAAGTAQFGVIDYSGALIRAGKGAFDPFRLVAGLNNQTLIAIMSLVGRGIMIPADLRGKTVAQAEGAVVRTLFPGYARLAGLDPATVHWVEVAATNLPALLASGRVDAIGQFVVGKPAVAAAAKRPVDEVVTLPYSTYMTDPYGNALVTTKQLIDTRPDLVRRFTDALMRGLVYTVANPEESGRILHTAVPATNPDTAAAEVRLLAAYVGGTPVGLFDPAKVSRGIALMQSLGQYPAAYPADKVVWFDAIRKDR